MTSASIRIAALALAAALTAPLSAAGFTLPFGGGSAENAAPPAPPRPVVTEILSDTATSARSTPGVIAASTEVQMAFQTLGRMIERPVDIGDRVAQGDLLARLNPEDLAGSVRAAEAAAAAAEVNLQTAQNTAERARALASRNVASTAQLEQTERALTAAQSSVEDSRAQLESARNAHGFAVMTAPIAGVISAVDASPGAVVAAGNPIMTLSSEDRLEARIDLPEPQLQGVGPGTRFLVWRDRNGGTPVEGTVSRISPVADAQTRTRRVFIALPDDSGMRIGSLIVARRAGADAARLTVPAAALVAVDGGRAVWVVARQGDQASVSLTRVTLAPGTPETDPVQAPGTRVEIASGLSAGDEIVIRGVHSLTQDQAVGRKVAP